MQLIVTLTSTLCILSFVGNGKISTYISKKKKNRGISWNLTLSLRLTKDKNCLKVVQRCLGVCKNTQIQRWKTSLGTSKKGFQVSCGNDMVFNSQTKWSYMAFRCLVITNTLVLNCSSLVAQLNDVCAGLTVRHPNWTHTVLIAHRIAGWTHLFLDVVWSTWTELQK